MNLRFNRTDRAGLAAFWQRLPQSAWRYHEAGFLIMNEGFRITIDRQAD